MILVKRVRNKFNGFTVVELVVVITAIAILSTLTILAYSSWRSQTAVNEVKSDLKNVAASMEDYRTFNNTYPTTIPTNFTSSPNVTLAMSIINGNATDYCIAATSTVSPSVVYYLQPSLNVEPQLGACPTIIANLHPNPTVEVNTTTFAGANSSTVTKDSTYYHGGSSALKVSMAAGASTTVGTTLYNMGSTAVGTILAANTDYTISAYVYVPTATTVSMTLNMQGAGMATKLNPAAATTSVKNTWVRLYNQFKTGTSGAVALYVLNTATATAGMLFWVDDVMLTTGTTPPSYADGSSPNWSWTNVATAPNSTSTGPSF